MNRATISSLAAVAVLGLIAVNWAVGARPAGEHSPSPTGCTPGAGSSDGEHCCLLSSAADDSAISVKHTLTLDGARRVLAAAIAKAKERSAGGAIAVVDDGGNAIVLERLDGTFAAGAAVSLGKARTAALFKKPTKAFEDSINGGRVALSAVHEMTPLQGGVPIVHEGQLVGAIGVSGAHSQAEDEEIAMAGAAAIAGMPVTATGK